MTRRFTHAGIVPPGTGAAPTYTVGMKSIAVVVTALAVGMWGAGATHAAAEPGKPTEARLLDERLVQAREALRKRDRARLAAQRDALVAARHPLAGGAPARLLAAAQLCN